MAIAALGCLASGSAQQMPWGIIPSVGPVSLAAYVRPPDVDAEKVGLDVICADGSVMPLLRLGRPAAPRDLDSVKIKLSHSHGYVKSTSLWHHDPLTSRAVP